MLQEGIDAIADTQKAPGASTELMKKLIGERPHPTRDGSGPCIRMSRLPCAKPGNETQARNKKKKQIED